MAKYNQVPDVQSQIAELQRRMLEMETATRFTNVNLSDGTSIQVGSGGVINVTDTGAIQISDEGQLFIDNAGSIDVGDGGDINVLSGGQVKVEEGGELISSGLLQVLGALSLPSGIIDNEALITPITVGMASTVTRTAWPVTVPYANLATAAISVPDGYSQALVFGIGSVVFQDTQPNTLYTRIVINDLLVGTQVVTPSDLQVSHTMMHTGLLSGITNEILIDIELKAGIASTDNDGRIAQVTGFAIFFR